MEAKLRFKIFHQHHSLHWVFPSCNWREHSTPVITSDYWPMPFSPYRRPSDFRNPDALFSSVSVHLFHLWDIGGRATMPDPTIKGTPCGPRRLSALIAIVHVRGNTPLHDRKESERACTRRLSKNDSTICPVCRAGSSAGGSLFV